MTLDFEPLDQAPDNHRCEDYQDYGEHTRNTYGICRGSDGRQRGVETWREVDGDVQENRHSNQSFNKVYV